MGQQNEANQILRSLEKEKCKGGFGKVWKVKCKYNNKTYALKQMSKLRIIDSASTSNIISEKNLLSKLHNNFIVNMLCSFQDFYYLYLVMDLYTGGDLRFHMDEYLNRNKTFTENQIKFLISNLILAIEYIHSKCVIHRDIKPENILFDKHGYLSITDFGIARINLEQNPIEVIGTPGYMAPEILMSQDYSYSVDYYALGIITYECMFNQRPYKQTKMTKLRKEMNEVDPKISQKKILFTEYSFEIADFVNELINKNPKKRLGAKSGIEEIKKHDWFQGTKNINSNFNIHSTSSKIKKNNSYLMYFTDYFNWDDICNKRIKSPFFDMIQKYKKDEIYDQEYIDEKNNMSNETKTRYENILKDNKYINIFDKYTCICFPGDKDIYPNENYLDNDVLPMEYGNKLNYEHNYNKINLHKNKNLPMLISKQSKLISNLKNSNNLSNNKNILYKSYKNGIVIDNYNYSINVNKPNNFSNTSSLNNLSGDKPIIKKIFTPNKKIEIKNLSNKKELETIEKSNINIITKNEMKKQILDFNDGAIKRLNNQNNMTKLNSNSTLLLSNNSVMLRNKSKLGLIKIKLKNKFSKYSLLKDINSVADCEENINHQNGEMVNNKIVSELKINKKLPFISLNKPIGLKLKEKSIIFSHNISHINSQKNDESSLCENKIKDNINDHIKKRKGKIVKSKSTISVRNYSSLDINNNIN